MGKQKYRRVQFTAWDREHNYEFDTPEYLEHELVGDALTGRYCAFGYVDSKNQWVKLTEVRREVESE